MELKNLLKIDPNTKYHISIELMCMDSKGKIISSSQSGSGEIQCTGSEIYQAILTCGMPSGSYLSQMNVDREEELRLKIAAFNSHFTIKTDKNGIIWLVLNNNNPLLDESELNVNTYYAGMIMTRLISMICSKVNCLKPFHLEVDYLVHLKFALVNSGNNARIKPKKGVKIPDFIGYRSIDDEYYVYEAKGAREPSVATIRKKIKESIDQVKAIANVNSKTVNKGVVCMTCAQNNKTTVLLYIVDRSEYSAITIDKNNEIRINRKILQDLVANPIREFKKDNYKSEKEGLGEKYTITPNKSVILEVSMDEDDQIIITGEATAPFGIIKSGVEVECGNYTDYTLFCLMYDLFENIQYSSTERESNIYLGTLLKGNKWWNGQDVSARKMLRILLKNNYSALAREYNENGGVVNYVLDMDEKAKRVKLRRVIIENGKNDSEMVLEEQKNKI